MWKLAQGKCTKKGSYYCYYPLIHSTNSIEILHYGRHCWGTGEKAVIPNLLGASIQHRPYCHRPYLLTWKTNTNRKLYPVMINSTEKNALQKWEWLITLCFSTGWLEGRQMLLGDIWAESSMKLGSKPQKSSDKEHSRRRGVNILMPESTERLKKNPLLTRLIRKTYFGFHKSVYLEILVSHRPQVLNFSPTGTTAYKAYFDNPCMCVKAWESAT